jgi:hypothetical protein
MMSQFGYIYILESTVLNLVPSFAGELRILGMLKGAKKLFIYGITATHYMVLVGS